MATKTLTAKCTVKCNSLADFQAMLAMYRTMPTVSGITTLGMTIKFDLTIVSEY